MTAPARIWRRPRAVDAQDLVVIGGGSAGITAARVAAALGARVTLVEREAEPGGDCLWTGCVPSKAFISAARRAHQVRTSADFGVHAMLEHVSFREVMEHVRAAQRAIAVDDSHAHLRQIGVTTHTGTASLHDGNVVTVDSAAGTTTLRGRHVLVASGSAPAVPDVPGLGTVSWITSDSFWNLRELPRHLVVLGGGPVGCELGQACARLGSKVTIVEAASTLLHGEELQASVAVAQALQAEGAEVLLGRRVKSFEDGHAILDDGSRITCDVCLIGVGRTPNTAGLCHGEAGCTLELDASGHVVVDRLQRTSSRRIWAAGDVTGQLPLTSAAGLQGANAVLNALLRMRRAFDPLVVPRVIFTDPEVARIGMTSQMARERFNDVEEVVMPMARVDRAIVTGAAEGELRLVTRSGTRLVGATWIGDTAGEQLAHLGSVLGGRRSVAALASMPHGYPTLGEASRNAAFRRQLERAASPGTRALLRRVIPVLSRLS